MKTMNKIEIDDIRYRSEHCKATNQDCKDLLEHIDILTSDIDREGSLLERLHDNICDLVDVENHVSINRRGLAELLKRNK